MSRWRVEGFHERLWLVQRSGWSSAAELPDWCVALAPSLAANLVDEWFPDGRGDAPSASTLASIAAALGEESAWNHEEARAHWKDAVRDALRSGRLVAARMDLPAPAGGGNVAEEDTRPAERAPRRETTWIEIVLVDSADPPQPVPYKGYRIELPCGEIREGRLDSQGKAMIRDIDPGTCQVAFLDLDEAVWQRV